MNLTKEEVQVLEKIASQSKMDCWFHLQKNDEDRYVVYDLEEGNILELDDGVNQLIEGMTAPKDYNLNMKELNTFIKLKKRFSLKEFHVSLKVEWVESVTALNEKNVTSTFYDSFSKETFNFDVNDVVITDIEEVED